MTAYLEPQTMADVMAMDVDTFVAWMQARFPQSAPPANPLGLPSSASIVNLTDALAKAQGEFPVIPRDRTVTVYTKPKEGRPASSYTFRYAPLETILQATRPSLSAHGLSLVQATVVDASGAEVVRTVLMHASGEWIQNDVPIFVGTGDNKSQAYSSGMTYSRRYGVTLLLCVAADEDDDGNGGEQDEGRQMPDYHRTSRGNDRRPSGGGDDVRSPQRRSDRPSASDEDEARRMFHDDERAPVDHSDAPAQQQDVAGLSPWGDDLSAGERKMGKQRAGVAGLDDAGVVELLGGQMTKANAAESLATLKRAADKALAG